MERGPANHALEATAALLVLAAACDALGLGSASFLVVVLTVPVVAAGGLAALARVIDTDAGRIHVALYAALLAVVLFGVAVRSPAVGEPGLPPAAAVSLAAAFVLVVLQGLAVLGERPARA